MTTPRDLLIIAMDMASSHSVDRGDLSLALAGAEAVDLLDARAIGLEGERIVPGPPLPLADRMLKRAAASLTREPPYEPVGEWLWRRGRGLPEAYLDTLEADGDAVRERHRRWMVFHTSELVLVDSSARRRAADRLRSDEPVLATLAAAVGISDPSTPESPTVTRVDDVATATVLTAVDDALGELAVERQRRAQRRDDATADNVRRGY
ncbi:GPP34 family phosphoprotein [Streptomyces sp. NA02950]|uniref:GOLPH3/VPS74 family protein n=1 Tax=Streptomyces sp. NA02950 TaxID=2742137 RepID=UPI0015917CE0|nr:GPP34 family phosphoprotein [Streptomyces sp. NA02950]QKV96475.1 GPP34 family phosphoprotein [Streptomyces sp. NA02950]